MGGSSTLRNLSMRSNRLGATGVRALAGAVGSPTTRVTAIDMSYCIQGFGAASKLRCFFAGVASAQQPVKLEELSIRSPTI
eukprot:32655-Eustigmatos_ZCMA.PRE.1